MLAYADIAGCQYSGEIMSGDISTIPVVSEVPRADHGNAIPLLHEIRHALIALVEQGQTTVIDLRALPMSSHDLAELEDALGQGEISVTLEASGPSEIRDTAIPGVWWVTHRNESGSLLARLIEIASVPAILCTPAEDLQQAVARLSCRLDALAHS
jgi:hydrogenase-1 operon protein HyaF